MAFFFLHRLPSHPPPPPIRWYVVADMTKSRSAAGVAVLSGEIFAAGGHDGLQIFSTVSISFTLWVLVLGGIISKPTQI